VSPAAEEPGSPLSAGVPLQLQLGDGAVSGLLLRPRDTRFLYVLAHGAGAGMRHAFMESAAAALAHQGIATLRYQFPYKETGRGRPDPPAVLEATVRVAVARAREIEPDLPLLAGGKSMGGRMTSQAQSKRPLPGVRGLVFLGFPLHPAGRPAVTRAQHLRDIALPMLFLQGTRDALADPILIRDVCTGLGSRATLHMVEGADHGFHVLKRSGRTDAEVLQELAVRTAAWAASLA
jgi:uncharacterized protein